MSDRVLLWAVVLNLGLSVFEFAAGLVSGSVALMADALHNTNDAAALLIAYAARRIARRAADQNFTFGYRRAELIGAMIQLTALIVIGLYLVYEAVTRFIDPQPLSGGWIMAASAVALAVDVVTAWLLWAMSRGSVNVRAAFLHNLTDAGASVAVLLGGAAIYWLNWSWVDPVLTLLIAGYILLISFRLLRSTAATLMNAAPAGIELDAVQAAIESIEGVDEMHHIHLWELDETRVALEAHLVLAEGNLELSARIKSEAKAILNQRFHIAHSTLEFEGPDEVCDDRTHLDHP